MPSVTQTILKKLITDFKYFFANKNLHLISNHSKKIQRILKKTQENKSFIAIFDFKKTNWQSKNTLGKFFEFLEKLFTHLLYKLSSKLESRLFRGHYEIPGEGAANSSMSLYWQSWLKHTLKPKLFIAFHESIKKWFKNSDSTLTKTLKMPVLIIAYPTAAISAIIEVPFKVSTRSILTTINVVAYLLSSITSMLFITLRKIVSDEQPKENAQPLPEKESPEHSTSTSKIEHTLSLQPPPSARSRSNSKSNSKRAAHWEKRLSFYQQKNEDHKKSSNSHCQKAITSNTAPPPPNTNINTANCRH